MRGYAVAAEPRADLNDLRPFACDDYLGVRRSEGDAHRFVRRFCDLIYTLHRFGRQFRRLGMSEFDEMRRAGRQFVCDLNEMKFAVDSQRLDADLGAFHIFLDHDHAAVRTTAAVIVGVERGFAVGRIFNENDAAAARVVGRLDHKRHFELFGDLLKAGAARHPVKFGHGNAVLFQGLTHYRLVRRFERGVFADADKSEFFRNGGDRAHRQVGRKRHDAVDMVTLRRLDNRGNVDSAYDFFFDPLDLESDGVGVVVDDDHVKSHRSRFLDRGQLQNARAEYHQFLFLHKRQSFFSEYSSSGAEAVL